MCMNLLFVSNILVLLSLYFLLAIVFSNFSIWFKHDLSCIVRKISEMSYCRIVKQIR